MVLALACFKAWVHLVDDVNPAFAAHQTVGAVTAFQGLKRVLDFHRTIPSTRLSAQRAHKKQRAASDTHKI